jgi:photosystem II stability/assembly factor-like uncharacterized protein
MKKVLPLIIIMFIILVSNAQEKWTMINPYPTLEGLEDAYFINEQEGWAVGSRGIIMYTNNGGETWDIQHENINEVFRTVLFIGESEGWVVGGKMIYHTLDKGQNWESQTWNSEPWSDLKDVFFFNQDTGIAVGTYKTILRTVDGGEHWSRIPTSIEQNLGFHRVHFTSDLHGCIVGNDIRSNHIGVVMITDDGGLLWTDVTPTDNIDYQSMFFIDSTTALVSGPYHKMIKTTDGGYTWTHVEGPDAWSSDIYFFDSIHGMITDYTNLYLTSDGGNTWDSIVQIIDGKCILGFHGLGGQKVVGVGYSGAVLLSTDMGYTWENMTSGINSDINQIGFFNAYNGYALTENSSNSRLISTHDGGYTWNFDTIQTRTRFARSKIMGASWYLLTDSLQLMKSSNQGQDWINLDLPDFGNYCNDLQILNVNAYFLIGQQGKFIKTANGGLTWDDKSLADTCNLTQVFFISDNVGWVIDNQTHSILRTIDGGNSWNSSQLGDVYIFKPENLFFVNGDLGFCTTYEGVLFRTLNGGVDWEEFFVFSNCHMSKLYFFNENEGWLKKASSIYHTLDGGVSWVDDQWFSGNQINDLFFTDIQHGWLGGAHGLVAVYNTTVGIQESVNSVSSVLLYPNPAENLVFVRINNNSELIREIQVFNMLGAEVIKISNLNKKNEFVVDMSALSKGTYIFKVSAAKSVNYLKVVKQ